MKYSLQTLAVLLACHLPLAAQTLFHYRVNGSDAALVSGGVVPNLGTLGDGSSGGSGVSLSADVPINGVPPDAGNRSIVCNGSGGILAPGTKQLLNADIASAGGFTYEAWFKWNGNGDFNSIIDYAGTEQLRRRTSDSGVAMRSSDGGSLITIGPAPSNTWAYAAAVFTPTGPVAGDGSITGDYVFYLDGNAPALTVTNVTITAYGDSLNRTIAVGMHPQGFAANFFNGLIYEPRVTLGALAPSQLLYQIQVTTAADSGPGSLRQVVSDAASGSTITFANYLSGRTITLTSGQLLVTNNLSIDASALPGGLTLDGNHQSRLFEFPSGTTNTLTGLILTNGYSPPLTVGGAIALNSTTLTINNCILTGNSSGGTVGGGIYNSAGTLTVNNSTVTGNSADGSGALGAGGIYNSGTLTINNSTLARNSAFSKGGGIYNDSGTLTIINSTLTRNSANSEGGGIYNYNGTLTIINSTLTGNSADIGGGIWNATVGIITNCIVGDNSAPSGADVSNLGTITLAGANIIPVLVNSGSGTTSGPGAITNSPLLAPLGYYGGPTETMPPLPGSPAIDAGNSTLLTTDQRGYPRPVGPGADIGAVEFQYANPQVSTTADSGVGSLRYTLTYAMPGSTVTFAPGLSGQTITLTNGQILVSNSLGIDASALAAGLTLDGNHQSRLFEFASGTTNTLTGLTFTNGRAVSGGAIRNAGTLAVVRCTLAGNSATNGGGALFNVGVLTLTNCTLTGNSARYAGAMANSLGEMFLTHATLTLNQSTGTNTVDGGGAVDNYSGAALTMTACILAGNTAATGDGPDLWLEDGPLTATHCLISDGTSSALTNGVNGNLVGTGSAPIDALLAPLGHYGGPTQTIPPLAGSPAIDAGGSTTLAMDQRGLPRPIGLAADIGAVEFQEANPLVTTTADSGVGSLRYAVTYATPASTITFAAGLSGQTITLANGQLLVTKSLHIDASTLAGGITLDGNHQSRLFEFAYRTTNTLTGLTLTNGYATDANQLTNGGAVFLNNNARLTLDKTRFFGNSAEGSGGAVFAAPFSTLLLNDNTLANNSAGYGGAIYGDTSILTLNSSTLTSNSASWGGAIFNDNGYDPLRLNNATLVGNSASSGGAIANNADSGAMLTHCTLTQNQSTGGSGSGGGAIHDYSGPITLIACILAGNTAVSSTGPDLWIDHGTLTATNCLIGQNNDSTIVDGSNGNHAGSSSSPLDAMLAPLGDYGGPTQTMPPLPGSPAIDAGGITSLTTDQRGYPRPVGLAADIGAVEVSMAGNPGRITSVTRLGNGSLQVGFTNISGSTFSVLASTNVALPLNQWSDLGPAVETPPGSGQFQFSDAQATNFNRRYYRVSSP